MSMQNQSVAPTSQPEDVAEPSQYLTFVLAGEVFAMRILMVKEIIEYGTLTGVPMMPRCVRGVINLRGAVVPAIDLLARFGQPSSPVTKRSCIVIVELEADAERGRQVVGVVVDAVNAVLEMPRTEIEPPPLFGARIRADFIRGIGKVDGRFVILLDIERLLSAEEIGELALESAA